LRRAAQQAMAKLHQGIDPVDQLPAIRRASRKLSERLFREGRGDEGVAHDALQESVEAELLAHVDQSRPLPGPTALGVEPEVWLSGLGDLVGEIRRLVLTRLSEGKLGEAERFLRVMEEVHRALMRFETTRSILQLKPKQDTSRALLERTRGDVTLARLLDRVERPRVAAKGESR